MPNYPNYISWENGGWLNLGETVTSFAGSGMPDKVHFSISHHPESEYINFHVTKNHGSQTDKPKFEIIRVKKEDADDLFQVIINAFYPSGSTGNKQRLLQKAPGRKAPRPRSCRTYASGEPLLFRVDVVNNFAAKEGMAKENSIREQMFGSIASWLSSELSQKQWCHQQGIAYHIFHYWYRKYRDEHPESPGSNSFVQLAVKPESGASCEVIFTDGTKIVFREAVPAQYLKSLLF